MAEQPLPKKVKKETIFDKFRSFPHIESFLQSYELLCTQISSSLLATIITSCDADAVNPGESFSTASCRVQNYKMEAYPFGSIFAPGITMLNKLASSEQEVEDCISATLLAALLDYLCDKESHDEMIKLQDDNYVESGTQVMTTIAWHFFGKLSASKSWTMDKYTRNKKSICKCGNCEVEDILKCFDDTSIGCRSVWHGSVDIVFESNDIGIYVSANTDEDASPGGRTSDESKMKDIDSFDARSQILAQTIVFSFLQKQRHPYRQHFLTPFIAADNKRFRIFFYDAKNDILLQSRDFTYVFNHFGKKVIDYEAVVAAWFVMNYKDLCSGPTDAILRAPNANFFGIAKDCLTIYESKLKFRNVYEEKIIESNVTNYDKLQHNKMQFVWPDAVDVPVKR